MVWEFECNFVIVIPEWHPSVNYFHLCQRCNKLYVKATVLFLQCRGWCILGAFVYPTKNV